MTSVFTLHFACMGHPKPPFLAGNQTVYPVPLIQVIVETIDIKLKIINDLREQNANEQGFSGLLAEGLLTST